MHYRTNISIYTAAMHLLLLGMLYYYVRALIIVNVRAPVVFQLKYVAANFFFFIIIFSYVENRVFYRLSHCIPIEQWAP